jgi:hypothetical protein
VEGPAGRLQRGSWLYSGGQGQGQWRASGCSRASEAIPRVLQQNLPIPIHAHTDPPPTPPLPTSPPHLGPCVGELLHYPLSKLITMPLINVSRSANRSDKVSFLLDVGTRHEVLKEVRWAGRWRLLQVGLEELVGWWLAGGSAPGQRAAGPGCCCCCCMGAAQPWGAPAGALPAGGTPPTCPPATHPPLPQVETAARSHAHANTADFASSNVTLSMSAIEESLKVGCGRPVASCQGCDPGSQRLWLPVGCACRGLCPLPSQRRWLRVPHVQAPLAWLVQLPSCSGMAVHTAVCAAPPLPGTRAPSAARGAPAD